MKKTLLGALLIAASLGAHAVEWRAKFVGGTYSATMSYAPSATGPVTSVSVSEAAGNWGSAAGPIGNFANLAMAQHTALENALNDKMNAVAAANNGKAWPGKLTGAITATVKGLTGAQLGKNSITFSGPSYKVTATASKYSITCQSTITLNHITSSVVYDPLTAAIDPDPKQTYLHWDAPGVSTSCSSPVDSVPIIGWLVDDLANWYVDTLIVNNIRSFQQSAVSQLIPHSLQNIGLDTILPTGKYVIGPTDWGYELKYNWVKYFAGKSFSLTIGEPIVMGEQKSGVNDPGDVVYNSTHFVVNLSDSTRQLKFSVTSSNRFRYSYYCPPNTLSCDREP